MRNPIRFLWKDRKPEDDIDIISIRTKNITVGEQPAIQPWALATGSYSKLMDKISTWWLVNDQYEKPIERAKVTITVQKNDERENEITITIDPSGYATHDIICPNIGDSYTFKLKRIEYDNAVWTHSEINHIDAGKTMFSVMIPVPELMLVNST